MLGNCFVLLVVALDGFQGKVLTEGSISAGG
jgi:hypothetical protein